MQEEEDGFKRPFKTGVTTPQVKIVKPAVSESPYASDPPFRRVASGMMDRLPNSPANRWPCGSVSLVTESDPSAHAPFLRLYVEHEPALRGFVRSLVPTLQDAQDVMQEVALALWKRFHTLSAPEDFRRWAFGVARLESLEFLRKRRRDRHVFGDELFDLLAAEAESAADDLAEERRALDLCLQKLPDEQRDLVQGCYAPGTRIDEWAARMGRTAMAVYKSLHRIRTVLIDCAKKQLVREGFS